MLSGEPSIKKKIPGFAAGEEKKLNCPLFCRGLNTFSLASQPVSPTAPCGPRTARVEEWGRAMSPDQRALRFIEEHLPPTAAICFAVCPGQETAITVLDSDSLALLQIIRCTARLNDSRNSQKNFFGPSCDDVRCRSETTCDCEGGALDYRVAPRLNPVRGIENSVCRLSMPVLG
jgi:hypothetical protein